VLQGGRRTNWHGTGPRGSARRSRARRTARASSGFSQLRPPARPPPRKPSNPQSSGLGPARWRGSPAARLSRWGGAAWTDCCTRVRRTRCRDCARAAARRGAASLAWAAQAKAACPAPRIRYRRTLAEASQDERPRVAARPAQRTTLRGQHQTPPAFGGPEPHPPPAAGVPLPSSHPRRRSSTAGTTALPRRSTMGRPRRRSTTAQPRRCALRLSMVDVHLMEILLPATDSALGGNEIRRPVFT
jgi:hypothetical protein